MRRAVTDIGLKLAALLIAGAFLLHVRSISGEDQTLEVPIAVPERPGFRITPRPAFARIRIRLPRKDFPKLKAGRTILRLDPGDVSDTSVTTVSPAAGNILWGSGSPPPQVLAIEPVIVHLEIEKLP